MVTYTLLQNKLISFFGLTTDQKPVGKIEDNKIRNGSFFYEIDSSKKYLYDEENAQWCQFVEGGGSSSEESSSEESSND